MEVRTEYGDFISAHRTNESRAMFDTRTKLPVHEDDRSLGVVGWLNNPAQMSQSLSLFHATSDSLRRRVQTDVDLIRLAQTPLDQLFDLADKITTAEEALDEVADERSSLAESKKERDAEERRIQQELEQQRQEKKKAQTFLFGALALVILGAVVAFLVELPVGAGICVLGVIIAIAGKLQSKRSTDASASAEAMEMQLDRVDELFSSQSITRSRRTAEEELAHSWEQWRSIAGEAKPSVLLRDRPRIEELASHLELISHAQVASPGDTSILVGLASQLAELSRSFPAERVPLLVEDIFHDIAPQYHALTRELLRRASHRRQVVLETADIETAKWAAVEAVGSDALLVTDYDIDVEPIIAEAQAVAAENAETV